MKKIKRIDKHKLDYYDDVTRGLDVIEQNFEELDRNIKYSSIGTILTGIAIAVHLLTGYFL